ncbi:MAG: metalloregulator ArsR/SmtB family transcription factor [Chloroflexota bacterium]
MDDANYILAPHIVQVRFDLAPALNAVDSIRELNEVMRLSGFGDWINQTYANLPAERREINEILYEALEPLFFEIMPPMSGYADFLSYVDALAALDSYKMRDRVVASFVGWPVHHPELWSSEQGALTAERFLNDEEAFQTFLAATCHDGTQPNADYAKKAHLLLNDPPRLHAILIEHLRWMWESGLADEWRRVEPMLRESIAAFERLDFSNMTAYEAIRAVTTRDLRGKIDDKIDTIETIVFVPSAHIGPYLVRFKQGTTVYCLFGARLPRGVEFASSALSRSELLIRMNALADDTRLRILELLTQHEELCAQDIIEMTELSQSSVSRHLSQLSATGFITERRRDVSKCYALNTDRVMDTLRTLTSFLSRTSLPLPPTAPRPLAAPSPPTPPRP